MSEMETVAVQIGDRHFRVRDGLSRELVKVLEEGKRFWEWEKEIAMLKEMLEAMRTKNEPQKE